MEQPTNTHFRRLQLIGYGEGISYILLLGVAMPLKYMAGIPKAVEVTGMVHGVLFIAYVTALLIAAGAYRWPAKKIAIAFLASLIPFGPFYLDKMLKGK
jgi:integral membrane protein